MSHYLTPNKVCLLVLVTLYCEGHVPASATVPVLSFIISQQLPLDSSKTRARIPGLDRQSQRPDGLQPLKAVLEKLPCVRSDASLWEQYLITLQQVAHVDTLYDFFQSSRSLFAARTSPNPPASIVITQTSLVGAFVRRSQLEFEKLNFQDVASLWQSYARFVSPFATLQICNDQDELQATDAACGCRISAVMQKVGDLGPSNQQDELDKVQISSHDAERILDAQHRRMQETQNRLQISERLLDEEISTLSSQSTTATFYVKFLEASMTGDYSTAFEYLHRCYDYDVRLKSGQSFYQLTLLSTALVQADLGCYSEAIQTLKETVSIARENKDTTCLISALHTLAHVRTMTGRDAPDEDMPTVSDSGLHEAAFLKAKAIENRAWPIVSATLLREAQSALSMGQPVTLALDKMHECATLNVRHRMWNEMKSQYGQQSVLFARIGNSALSMSYNNLIMDLVPRTQQAREEIQARCRNAFAAAMSGDFRAAEKYMKDGRPSAHHTLQVQQLYEVTALLIKLKRYLLR
ncbi:MAG: hypothetical protein Q9162_003300 [Coniocarpon cinnabarinum]